MSESPDTARIRTAIIEGDGERLVRLIKEATGSGMDPRSVMYEGLVRGMRRVGELYDSKEFFVPEVLLSATAMKSGLSVLRPMLAERKIQPPGRVALGTVKGDVHDIGKNIVALTLEGAGFEVLDLGADVSPERFVGAALDGRAQVVGMSALLTTTRVVMREVIERLEEEGSAPGVKVLIGGAAVSSAFAEEIGAHAYGSNAVEAVRITRELLGVADGP